MLRRGNHASAKFWRRVLLPVVARYRSWTSPSSFGAMRPSPGRRCTGCWRKKTTSMQSAFRPTTCWNVKSSIY